MVGSAGLVLCTPPPNTGRMVTDMPRILIAILMLLYPCLSFAGTAQVRAMMGMWGGASSGVSYLLTEDFESTSAPSGWTNNLATFGVTPALYGSYSTTVTAAQYATSGAFTATGTIYASALLEIGTALPTSTVFLKLMNGSTEITGIRIRSTGAVQGESTQSATGVVSVGTPIYIKIKSTKGTGSNAELKIWTSSTGGEGTWTERVSVTTSTRTSDVDRVRIASASDGTNAVFKIDRLRVSVDNINY